jgi:hypothetical protein
VEIPAPELESEPVPEKNATVPAPSPESSSQATFEEIPAPKEEIIPSPSPSPLPVSSSIANQGYYSRFGQSESNMWLGQFKNRLAKSACGFSEATYIQRQNWAAVNMFSFRNAFGFHPCGLCAKIACTEEEDCSNSGPGIEVMFVDDCGSCSGDDILLSAEGYKVLGATTQKAAIPIAWELVPCNPNNGVFMSILTDGPYYHRVSFSGLSEPIKQARINGMMSTKNVNGQFEFFGDLKNDLRPYSIQLQGINGEIIQTSVQNLYSQPLNIQFRT